MLQGVALLCRIVQGWFFVHSIRILVEIHTRGLIVVSKGFPSRRLYQFPFVSSFSVRVLVESFSLC